MRFLIRDQFSNNFQYLSIQKEWSKNLMRSMEDSIILKVKAKANLMKSCSIRGQWLQKRIRIKVNKI